MGDPTPLILRTTPYTAEALLRHMIERVVQQVADHEGAMPRSTVLTHPANWGPYKLDLFDQATRMAKIGPVSRVSEPHAAATAYANQLRVPDGAIVAVYDLGGGTFDAAVLRKDLDDFTLLGESVGIEHLGGVDFDDAIFYHVRAALGSRWPSDPDDLALQAPMVHLRRSCTESKELLSTEPNVSIPVMLPGLDTTVPLDRRRFEAMIAPRIEDTLSALDSALASANVGSRRLYQVVLVGGSSRIPLVAQQVARAIRRSGRHGRRSAVRGRDRSSDRGPRRTRRRSAGVGGVGTRRGRRAGCRRRCPPRPPPPPCPSPRHRARSVISSGPTNIAHPQNPTMTTTRPGGCRCWPRHARVG